MKTIQEILAKAKIDQNGNLDESIASELEEIVDEMVTEKVNERAKRIADKALGPITEEAKQELAAEYENKFEDYKTEISEQFSTFCDQVFDQELELPENVVEYARLGERYHDLIEELRARIAIDEGAVDAQVKEVMQEAKNEIESLREQLNAQIAENVKASTEKSKVEDLIREARDTITQLRVENYVHENYAYMPKSKRQRMINLLGNVEMSKIDEEIKWVQKTLMKEDAESMGNDKPLGQEKTPVQAELEHKCKCPSCGKVLDVANNVACSAVKCPECDDTHLEDCTDCPTNEEKERKKYENRELHEDYVKKAAGLFATLID